MMRPTLDKAISDVIAELNFKFRKLNASDCRRKMRLYGVEYSYRDDEEKEPGVS